MHDSILKPAGKITYEGLTPDEAEFATDVFGPSLENVRIGLNAAQPIVDTQNELALQQFVREDLETLVRPFLNALVASTALERLEADVVVASSTQASNKFLYAGIAATALGLLLTLGLGVLVYRSITQPVSRIAEVVFRMSDGDFEGRTGLRGEDELSTLGAAMDHMLNERVAVLTKAEQENQALNDSVVNLLGAVARLSQRDLTVRVPVTEDVTGTLADSLNLLTDETAKVLQGVRRISAEVARSSEMVKEQSDEVLTVAVTEQQEVATTAKQLTEAARAMVEIAKLARASDDAAGRAIQSTNQAMTTVTDTVSGINGIRDTIRETEKRIKRLGDRSQEISGVVNLINSIAERTHILALNASMHAASAGEAGRGFAVVADEVQRLAENAREATSQIATLVSNIQVETADTVTTMNNAISQVVDGSRLAEQAGEQMKHTSESTANLVSMVQKIARSSRQQAQNQCRFEQTCSSHTQEYP